MAADVPRSVDRGAEVPRDKRPHVIRFAWHSQPGVARPPREGTAEWLFLRPILVRGDQLPPEQDPELYIDTGVRG